LLVCNLILRRNGYNVLTLAGCEKMEELVEAVETFLPELIFGTRYARDLWNGPYQNA